MPPPPGRCGRSPRAGGWGNRVSPCPHPREGLGGLRPPRNNRMFIAALCGGAAWAAEVNIVRRVQPPSQPPPAGGRRRVPAPSGGGSGRGPSPCPRRRDAGVPPVLPGRLHRAVCAPRMGPAVNIRPRRGGWGNRVSPCPRPREGAGAARAQGDGETGFPHSPTRGRVWEGAALPGTTVCSLRCCAAQPHGRLTREGSARVRLSALSPTPPQSSRGRCAHRGRRWR